MGYITSAVALEVVVARNRSSESCFDVNFAWQIFVNHFFFDDIVKICFRISEGSEVHIVSVLNKIRPAEAVALWLILRIESRLLFDKSTSCDLSCSVSVHLGLLVNYYLVEDDNCLML